MEFLVSQCLEVIIFFRMFVEVFSVEGEVQLFVWFGINGEYQSGDNVRFFFVLVGILLLDVFFLFRYYIFRVLIMGLELFILVYYVFFKERGGSVFYE